VLSNGGLFVVKQNTWTPPNKIVSVMPAAEHPLLQSKTKRVAPKKDVKPPALSDFSCVEIKTPAGVDTAFVATSSDGSHQFQIGLAKLEGRSGPTAIQEAFAAGFGMVQWATDEPGVFETIDQQPIEKQIMAFKMKIADTRYTKAAPPAYSVGDSSQAFVLDNGGLFVVKKDAWTNQNKIISVTKAADHPALADPSKRKPAKEEPKPPAVSEFTWLEIKTPAGPVHTFVAEAADGSHMWLISIERFKSRTGPSTIDDSFEAGQGFVLWATDEPAVFETIDQQPYEKQSGLTRSRVSNQRYVKATAASYSVGDYWQKCGGRVSSTEDTWGSKYTVKKVHGPADEHPLFRIKNMPDFVHP